MTVIETAKVTSKGQITIPHRIRKILRVFPGTSLGFTLSKDGIVLLPCKITAELPYTPSEWAKIEKLTFAKGGKAHKSVRKAKKHIEAL